MPTEWFDAAAVGLSARVVVWGRIEKGRELSTFEFELSEEEAQQLSELRQRHQDEEDKLLSGIAHARLA